MGVNSHTANNRLAVEETFNFQAEVLAQQTKNFVKRVLSGADGLHGPYSVRRLKSVEEWLGLMFKKVSGHPENEELLSLAATTMTKLWSHVTASDLLLEEILENIPLGAFGELTRHSLGVEAFASEEGFVRALQEVKLILNSKEAQAYEQLALYEEFDTAELLQRVDELELIRILEN